MKQFLDRYNEGVRVVLQRERHKPTPIWLAIAVTAVAAWWFGWI